MSDATDRAQRIASDIADYIQRAHSDADPMETTMAVALLIGGMVGSLNELGLTKQGRTGEMLDRLFELAEQTVIAGASA